MTTKEIADRLVELCRKGDFETAQNELFAKDAVSIEPYATPAFEKETAGINAILEKGRKWNEMVEQVHGIEISEPLLTKNAFACTMNMKVTVRGQGFMDMTELCLYRIKDGKIISEEFIM